MDIIIFIFYINIKCVFYDKNYLIYLKKIKWFVFRIYLIVDDWIVYRVVYSYLVNDVINILYVFLVVDFWFGSS